jgi:hypothetical protein
MKLKILSVFLALGMFVLGAEVSAQEESNAPEIGCSKTTEERLEKWALVQKGLEAIIGLDTTLQAGCKALSDELKAAKGVTKTNVMNCEKALNAEKANPKVASVISAVLKLACGGLCTGTICKSCADPVIANLCGGLCCNLKGGDSLLGACKNFFPNKNCSSFINSK